VKLKLLLENFKTKQTLTVLWNLLLIFAGSVICAVAIKGILIPKQFLAGGVTGLALLGHYIFPSLPLGFIYFLLNIPLFVIGWMFVGRRFFWYSLAGMIIFSAVIFWPYPVFPVEDMILNALTAGIITGLGSGMILRSLGSANDGHDVPRHNAVISAVPPAAGTRAVHIDLFFYKRLRR